jgi:hypothetical protein
VRGERDLARIAVDAQAAEVGRRGLHGVLAARVASNGPDERLKPLAWMLSTASLAAAVTSRHNGAT